jgi:hypothetical protein
VAILSQLDIPRLTAKDIFDSYSQSTQRAALQSVLDLDDRSFSRLCNQALDLYINDIWPKGVADMMGVNLAI